MVWCCVVAGKRYNCPGPGSCLPPCPHNHATPDQKHPNILALEISSLRVRMDMGHISNIKVFLKLCEFWFQNQILFKRHLNNVTFLADCVPCSKRLHALCFPKKTLLHLRIKQWMEKLTGNKKWFNWSRLDPKSAIPPPLCLRLWEISFLSQLLPLAAIKPRAKFQGERETFQNVSTAEKLGKTWFGTQIVFWKLLLITLIPHVRELLSHYHLYLSATHLTSSHSTSPFFSVRITLINFNCFTTRTEICPSTKEQKIWPAFVSCCWFASMSRILLRIKLEWNKWGPCWPSHLQEQKGWLAVSTYIHLTDNPPDGVFWKQDNLVFKGCWKLPQELCMHLAFIQLIKINDDIFGVPSFNS